VFVAQSNFWSLPLSSLIGLFYAVDGIDGLYVLAYTIYRILALGKRIDSLTLTKTKQNYTHNSAYGEDTHNECKLYLLRQRVRMVFFS
jgi:hypothetical protein